MTSCSTLPSLLPSADTYPRHRPLSLALCVALGIVDRGEPAVQFGLVSAWPPCSASAGEQLRAATYEQRKVLTCDRGDLGIHHELGKPALRLQPVEI